MGQSLSPLRVVPYSRITGFVIVVNRLADFLSGCFLPVLHEFEKSGWSMLTLLMQRGHECVEINRSGLWQLLHRGRRWIGCSLSRIAQRGLWGLTRFIASQ